MHSEFSSIRGNQLSMFLAHEILPAAGQQMPHSGGYLFVFAVVHAMRLARRHSYSRALRRYLEPLVVAWFAAAALCARAANVPDLTCPP